jgi:transposase
LLEHVEPQALLADKAYDADALIETLDTREFAPVIPPKASRRGPRQTDFVLYRERTLVEQFFNELKHFRANAARYDETARNFLAVIRLVAITCCLN